MRVPEVNPRAGGWLGNRCGCPPQGSTPVFVRCVTGLQNHTRRRADLACTPSFAFRAQRRQRNPVLVRCVNHTGPTKRPPKDSLFRCQTGLHQKRVLGLPTHTEHCFHGVSALDAELGHHLAEDGPKNAAVSFGETVLPRRMCSDPSGINSMLFAHADESSLELFALVNDKHLRGTVRRNPKRQQRLSHVVVGRRPVLSNTSNMPAGPRVHGCKCNVVPSGAVL